MTGTLKNPNITGHVRAYDGSVNKFLVDELSGDYSVNDGAITMKNFKLQALTSTATFAGTIAKNGDLALGIDATASCSSVCLGLRKQPVSKAA